jgi:2-dehydropantoate 2-reductase
MKILIIGAGAIGGYYGSYLARQGAEVSYLARSDYAYLKEHGFAISGLQGDYAFRPAQVLRAASELSEKPDYAMLCVKVAAGVDRVGLLRGVLGPETAIVLLSNGVEIEDEIAAAYPSHEIISGLAFICVTRIGPGKILHQAYGRLALGAYPVGISAKTQALCEAFGQAGLSCSAEADVIAARWRKCVWNAAFNPLSVLSGGLSTAEVLSTQEPFVRAIMAEVASIAGALKHPLPDDIVELNIASTYQMPPYKTSMLLDYEGGRPMETEAILGNAVRRGRSLGVAIPHLESIYALMKLRELRLAQEA